MVCKCKPKTFKHILLNYPYTHYIICNYYILSNKKLASYYSTRGKYPTKKLPNKRYKIR